MREFRWAQPVAVMGLCAPALASTWFGSSGSRHIEDAVALPLEGVNFAAYSEFELDLVALAVHP